MEGRNLVYAAPTSGGKSLVAEVLAVRALVRQERRVLVVEPYVAIVEEKVQMLRELLA
jgi:replicative superfamily II helicase